MKRILTAIWVSLFASFPLYAQPSIGLPALSEQPDYAEYWEQQFYFETGALLTSQFLIANLPLSKHHGLMVASLKIPGEPPVIIKNGRKRDGWFYAREDPELSIFQHRLKGTFPGFLTQLNNTAAEVDVLFNAKHAAIDIIAPGNDLGLPAVTLYATGARAFGRWRAGPEIGGAGENGSWQALGHGEGFGLHVIQDKPLGSVLRRWVRLTPLQADTDYELMFHRFETPSGKSLNKFYLLQKFKEPVLLDVSGVKFEEDNSMRCLSSARMTGTITISNEIETFLVADQLNGIERLVAGSLANISRYRSLVSYDFDVVLNSKSQSVSGTAILEEILVDAEKKSRRNRRR